MLNRSHFLGNLAGDSLAAGLSFVPHLSAADHGVDSNLKITSVEACPLNLWNQPVIGAVPDFKSDFDPGRWR